MQDRLFRLEEANALIPRLSQTFAEVRQCMATLEDLVQRLSRAGYRVTPSLRVELDLRAPAEVQEQQRALLEHSKALSERLAEVRALGIEVKAADGLVDFRSRYEGRIVFLCWRFGEERITHWHDIEAGFAGRQPIVDANDFEGDYLQ